MTTRWKQVNRPGSQKGPSATPHLSGVGFSEGGHHVCKDRARLGEEGLPAPQIGCPCGTTLVSVVSVFKKRTRKSPQRPLPLHFGFPGPSLSWNLRYRIGDWPGYFYHYGMLRVGCYEDARRTFQGASFLDGRGS